MCVHVWVDGYVHGDIECLAVSWPHFHAVVTHCMYVDPHVHGGVRWPRSTKNAFLKSMFDDVLFN